MAMQDNLSGNQDIANPRGLPITSDFEVGAINNETGYKSFRVGAFVFRRDEYFARLSWPGGSHQLPIDAFLRALMRDVAWNFFYGTVNFDTVFGTTNYYGEVEVFAGTMNEAYRSAGRDFIQRFRSDELRNIFSQILDDWTIDNYDPFAAPLETDAPWGVKRGHNSAAISRQRVTAQRMVGLPDDTPKRTDESGYPVNRAFADVDQSEPLIFAEPGFEQEVSAFNLFAYLSRSDVTWNPSVCSVVRDSLFCPTTEEFILPVEHGNDRVEWFLQLSDEIVWEVKHAETGKPRATVTMRAGDIACMPADIRHQGYSNKRSMLLVWENGASKIPEMVRAGTAPVVPVSW